MIKFRTIAILFLLMQSVTAQSQTYSSIVPDNEICDFLNWLTKHDDRCIEKNLFTRVKISQKINNWMPENFFKKDTVFRYFDIDNDFLFSKGSAADSCFSEADRDYLYKQFTAQCDSIWKKPFKGAVFAQKGRSKHATVYYSIPLFSLDRKYVIVKMSCYCDELNAFGGYFIYRKMGKNRWKFVDGTNVWQS